MSDVMERIRKRILRECEPYNSHGWINGNKVAQILDEEENKERKCIHMCGEIHKNEIGEDVAFCDIWDCERNITLGECIGNCESEMEEKQVCEWSSKSGFWKGSCQKHTLSCSKGSFKHFKVCPYCGRKIKVVE